MDVFTDIETQIERLATQQTEFDIELKYKMLVSFIEIQRLNRTLNTSTRQSKVACLDYKALLDKLHLSIQNLNYESQYITKEIHKCNAQETLFQDIELFTMQEFKVLAESNELAVDFDDSYALMKSRLEHELQERKKMAGNLLALKEKKIEILTQIKSKQLELDQFEKNLGDLLFSTLPIQKQIGVEQTIVRDINYKAAQALPAPLFHAFNTCIGYLPLTDLSVEIQSNPGASSSTEYQAHPGSLKFNVRQDETLIASIELCWLSKIKVVVASADLTDSFENIPSSFILSNLLKGDKGLECPNPSAQYLEGLEFDVDAASGLPFIWAQALAGLNFPSVALWSLKNGIWLTEEEGEPIPILAKISKMIQERRKQLIRLNTILAGLVLKLGNKKELRGQLISFTKLPTKSISCCSFQSVIEVEDGRKFGAEIILHASYPSTHCSMNNLCLFGSESSREILEELKMDPIPDSSDEKLIERQIISLISYFSKQ